MKILEYAAIAENNINHPLAKAVEEMARQRNIAIGGLNNSNDNLVTVGKGVTRIYNGRKISVGNLKFMEQEIMLTQNSISGLQVYGLLVKGKNYHQHFVGRGGQDNNTGQMLQTRNKDSIGNKSHDYIFAFTTAFVALDKQVIGAVLFEDTLRKEAKEAVTKLKSMGVRVIMLTGDNEEIAKRIAHHAGINEYYANLLPLNKVLKIEEIVNEEKKGKSKTVIMIGDGINDAPALAKADVGMAMGRTGTDMAIETADVILMTEDLTKIPYLLRKSRQALWTVQQNFYGTLFIDGLGFVLAFAGMLNPLSAVIIHVSSELIFMINSARLLIHT
jgi:cation transport ATPase